MERVLVVGGGISGLAVGAGLAANDVAVVVREADDRLGGKIHTSPFAGLDGVDEGADAFLSRVPDAVAFAGRVGLGDDLVSPTGAAAAVWHHGLHRIPDGLVLGVPGELGPLARSHLLSWRGKARAALEPLLPRTPTDTDAIGPFIRSRFGHEVHERLVDALVGSIYAADTDSFSLAAVPQLADLATRDRSLLLAAHRTRRAAVSAPPGSIFAAPRAGVGALVDAAADAIRAAGGEIRTGSRVTGIERDGGGWRVDDDRFDAVVLASPARVTAPLVRGVAPDAADAMASVEHVDVVLVTMAVAGDEWPQRLSGLSGYLVPKPDQGVVTAASFGSQKWAHWRPADGSQVLRVSLGRDGLPVSHLDDDQAVQLAIAETGRHLDLELAPTAIRVSRWVDAFPQYRPHHHERVATIEAALPEGLHVAGASYRGIGIPACVRQADALVQRLTTRADDVR